MLVNGLYYTFKLYTCFTLVDSCVVIFTEFEELLDKVIKKYLGDTDDYHYNSKAAINSD